MERGGSNVADDVIALDTFSPPPRHHRSFPSSQPSLQTPSTQRKRMPSGYSCNSGSKSSSGRCGLSGSHPGADDEDEVLTEHKIQQRQKQIQYGFNTSGYQNMMRLLASDPRLCKGGVLPLEPPAASLKTSKRAWDVLARKWRRALHLFDDVFIDATDSEVTTLEAVVEEQRKKWVSPRYAHLPKESRTPMSREMLLSARNHTSVPKRLPVEECMKPILRSLDCFEDLNRVVPDSASSLIKGNTGVSPTDAGIKMFIAPSAEASLFNHFAGDATRSPSPDMAVTPSTIAQMRATSPLYGSSMTSSSMQRSTSPTARSPSLAVFGSGLAVSTSGSPIHRDASTTRTSPTHVDSHCSAAGAAVVPSRLSPLATPFQPPSRPTRDFSPALDHTLATPGFGSTVGVDVPSPTVPSFAPPPPLVRRTASPIATGTSPNPPQ